MRSATVITCFVIALTIDAAAMGVGMWTSFTGVDHPTPAEIEVVEQDGDSVLVDMMLDGMNVQEREEHGREFQFLSIPQAGWTNETGKPKLPVVRALLTIPSDSDVGIQIEDGDRTILREYNVYPVGEKVRRSRGEAVYIDEEFTFDEEFYSTFNGFYPQSLADISFSGHLRDQRLIQLEFRPVRYNPHSGDLICYSFLRVRLTYESNGLHSYEGGKAGTEAHLYEPLESIWGWVTGDALSVTGGSGGVSYPDKLTDSHKADYVIIAPDPFYSSQKLRQLADWRAEYSGVDVAVVSAARLYNYFDSGGRLDETIRTFIEYAYDLWTAEHMPDRHVGYVLLVGDVELLPIHISERRSFDEAIATDNWYACIRGDDLLPDVMLGRLPAKNMTELNIMVDKTIQYEQDPLYGEWANNALLMLGTVESLREDMEYARDEYLLPAGYNVNEVSALDGGTMYNVVSEINRGQHIVDYAGHGWVNGWEIFRTLDIPRLRNDRKLPAIFSLACSTGQFDNPDSDSLAEALLKARNGAIAFFGSSRLASISDVGFGLSQAVAGSHIYTLGEIAIHAKLKLLPYSTNMELYNLLGDPALDLCAARRQPGKADLVVSPVDISFEPVSQAEMPVPLADGVPEFQQGEQVQINVVVYNLGAADARDVMVELRDGGSAGASPSRLIETHRIPKIAAGDRTEIQTIWRTPLGEAQHDISVEVYTEENTLEYYRENNDAQKTLLVSLEAEGWPVEVQERTLSAPIAADIDVDGDMELLVQTNVYNYNKLYIWHHEGQPVSGWPRTVSRSSTDSRSQYANSSAGPAPAVGDLDGDGTPEIVAVFYTNEVHAWRSDGSKFPGWPVTASGYATSSPVLADLDADGKLEVAFGLSNGQMDIRRYDGSQFPGWPISVGRQGHLFPIVTDMDGDTDLEIAALHSPLPKSSSVTTSNLYAWHHDGTAVSGWPVVMQGADAMLPPAAGDLDGDGTAEIVAISVDDDVCRVYVWNHNGSLVPGWPITTDDEIRSAVALGDLDRDGDVEIIACPRYDLAYAWHHNGRRVFGWPVNIGEEYWSSAPVLGDVDGDDLVEVIFASYGGVIHAYKHDGGLVQGWPAITEERSGVSPPVIADMDGNGGTELVYASGSGRLHMLSLVGHYNTETGIEWNMFSHDQMHTGSYNAKAILPLPPTSLTASDAPDDRGGSIALSWKLSPDDDSAAGYIIYRADSFDGRYSIVGKVPTGVSTYTDDTAQVGVTYWYVVRTSSGTYLSVSSISVSAYSFNNFAPEPPRSVQARKGSIDGTMDIWWLAGQEADLAGYKVYSGVSSGSYGEPVNIGMGYHYTLTGLTDGAPYYASVTAYDTEGNESLHSREVSAIPGDDDTGPPSFSAFHPKEVAEGTAFYIKCTISDLSGVYDDSSGADGQGVYLIWDDDGELSESSYTARMSSSVEGIYVTDEKIPGQSIGEQFIYQVYAYDNDYDWGNEDDRTHGISQKQTVEVLRAPSRAYNYPNPAPAGEYTDRTIFRYYVASDSDVRISIYDIAGHLVDSLETEARGGGYNETEWNISGIASGVYVYVIEIQPASGNKQIIEKKLAIVK